ncbi:MAG TPA: Wzt carbohydrate-binding domain-containing protein, partial [Gemmatales bacterium]|nr:Wzt carbohydrate-binding domain-containing protein [Gemmatales bacterium]
IVAFAEIEKFLDTPVKRYSSGMYVRLAFAVAAHLEPEILIVDEVLAVGDATFQKRCLGKMGEVKRSGRTVIVVSHNTAMLRFLCSTCILMKHGKLESIGKTDVILSNYLQDASLQSSHFYELATVPRQPGKTPIISALHVMKASNDYASAWSCGDQVKLILDLNLPYHFSEPQVGIGFDDIFGQRIASVGTFLSKDTLPDAEGKLSVECIIDDLPLCPGQYTLSLSVGNMQNSLIDQLDHVVTIMVEEGDFYGNGRYPMRGLGQSLLRSRWKKVSSI